MPRSLKTKAFQVLWTLIERGQSEYTALVFAPTQQTAWLDWDTQGNHSHIDGSTPEAMIDSLYQLLVDKDE